MPLHPFINNLISTLRGFNEDARHVLRSFVSQLCEEHKAHTLREQMEILHLAIAIGCVIASKSVRRS